jgi:hypothetical protein
MIRDSEPIGSSRLAIISMVLDPQIDQYEREVFTILDLIGNIGGLLEVCQLGGVFIIGVFSEKLFYFSVINRLHHLEVDTINKSRKKHNDEQLEKHNK